MSYPNPVFSTFAFISFVLVSIPFPWHLEAWNTGTCLYMAWTSLACLNQFINSIVWNGNAINWAPVWCDISARFMIGYPVGILASSLCINRRLYHIACVKSVTTTRAEKHRAIMIDLAIGLGLPLLVMPLQYIVQGHRFDIYEDIGCWPTTFNTPPAYVIVFVPPLVIGLISGFYSVRTIFTFRKRQAQFKELLSSNSNLNSNRYFRLMCLAGIEVICTVPLSAYAIYLNATTGVISPWISWYDTHEGFSRVDQIPVILWRNNPILASSLELSRWLVVLCGFIFFAFFGFADEAQKHYRLAFRSVAKHVGYSTMVSSSEMTSSTGSRQKASQNMSSTGGGVASLPVYMRKEIVRKRDSLDTLSDSDLGSIKDVGGAMPDSSLKSPPPFASFDDLSFTDIASQSSSENGIPDPPTPSSDGIEAPGPDGGSVNPPQSFLEISPRFTELCRYSESIYDVEAPSPRP